MSGELTFDTKVWEQDYEVVLDPDRMRESIARNQFTFATRRVVINNVRHPRRVLAMARRLVALDIIDDVVLVDDYAVETLAYFGLTRESFGAGYVYSIAELVALYLSTTEYLLHFSGDTVLDKPMDWIPPTLDLMRRRDDVVAANVVWNQDYAAVRSSAFDSDGDHFISYGFSDQMYLVRTDPFRTRIYEETNSASARYPAYGGELFEKRVDSWMRNHERLRATWSLGSYTHSNIRRLEGRARLRHGLGRGLRR